MTSIVYTDPNMTELELEIINEYLFNRYDKLIVDVNNLSILKQDDNDKKFNIIDLISKYSHSDYFTLHNLLSKYIKNCSFPDQNPYAHALEVELIQTSLNLSKKEYYDKYILEHINQIYKQYKIYLFNKNVQHMPESRFGRDYFIIPSFIDELLQEIKKDKEYYDKYIYLIKMFNKNVQHIPESRFGIPSFMDELLQEIKKDKQKKSEEKQKLDKQKKSEEKQKLDKHKKLEGKEKLKEQKKLEEENVKLKQELQKQTITKSKSDCEAHKKKKKPISATIKRLVWNTNIGEQIGKAKCMCCNVTDITQMSFNCGHIIAESNGGETIVSNLKPICQNCNSSMGTKDMEEFIKTLK